MDEKGHLRLAFGKRREQCWWERGWIRDRKRWRNGAWKLHLQFRHASKNKLKQILDEAYWGKESYENVEGCKREVEEVCDKCETCFKLKKMPETNSRDVFGKSI